MSSRRLEIDYHPTIMTSDEGMARQAESPPASAEIAPGVFSSVPLRERAPILHMPQLDGLRAFAVAAVLVHHFSHEQLPALAALGVKLFFVLSGFLITGLLIRARDEAEREGGSRRRQLKHFFARRFLRIFPLYYAVVGVAFAFGVPEARENIVPLLTYTLNLTMAAQGWYVAHFAHFWSLCIEEQFYLLWPWIVFFVPRKRLLPAVCLIAALGPLYRFYLYIAWQWFDADIAGLSSYIVTPTSFDSLGTGAILALLAHADPGLHRVRRIASRVLLPLGAALIAVSTAATRLGDEWATGLVFGDTGTAFVFGWLVLGASIGFPGPVGRVLNAAPLRSVGKIAYGIYVYHPLVPSLLAYGAAQAGFAFTLTGPAFFLTATAATLLMASLSWVALEKPMNNLKRHFTT